MLLVEVNVESYVKWLLNREPAHKIPQLNDAAAVRVARRLSAIASRTADPSLVETLARDISGFLLLSRTAAKTATKQECRKFLKEFGHCVGADRSNQVLTLVEDVGNDKGIEDTLASRTTYVEYRSENGGASYYRRQLRRKWPEDDLSLRIRFAFDALTAAEHPRPIAFIAQELGTTGGKKQGWTIQDIESRLKAFVPSGPCCTTEDPQFWLLEQYYARQIKEQKLDPPLGTFPKFLFKIGVGVPISITSEASSWETTGERSEAKNGRPLAFENDQSEHPEQRFVGHTIAQGLVEVDEATLQPRSGTGAYMVPLDPADPRLPLHRVTAELIEQYPHLNDSYLGAPVEGHPGWFHVLPEDPTFAGWVNGVYQTTHIPTGSGTTYRKVFREVNGEVIRVWEAQV